MGRRQEEIRQEDRKTEQDDRTGDETGKARSERGLRRRSPRPENDLARIKLTANELFRRTAIPLRHGCFPFSESQFASPASLTGSVADAWFL